MVLGICVGKNESGMRGAHDRGDVAILDCAILKQRAVVWRVSLDCWLKLNRGGSQLCWIGAKIWQIGVGDCVGRLLLLRSSLGHVARERWIACRGCARRIDLGPTCVTTFDTVEGAALRSAPCLRKR